MYDALDTLDRDPKVLTRKDILYLEDEMVKKIVREAKDNFLVLLTESLSAKLTFNEFANKYGKDDRFKGIDDKWKRESMFYDFMIPKAGT